MILTKPSSRCQRQCEIDRWRTSGLSFADDGRTFVPVDWDHDGDLDLWLVSRTAPQVRFMRNDSGAGARAVAFRLTGSAVNRDAIGSRIDVRGGGRRLVRLLQAGTGYLAQSSKWIHFGVGDLQRLDEVTVSWPDGSVQRFAGVETGRRYRLTQGDTALVPVEQHGVRDLLPLQPSEQRPLEPTEVANIGLTWRVGIPELRVEAFDGSSHVIGRAGRPLLVSLWASWCPSCAHELGEWVSSRERIERSGLEILALAVDEVQAGTSSDAAREAADRMGLWFPAGPATDELLVLLEVLQTTLVDRHRQLPVPAGFLLDARGRLARIYKGPVSTDRLLEDVAALSLDGIEAARASLPFPGRWHGGPHFPGVLRIGERLLEQGRPEFARFYAAQALEAGEAAIARSGDRVADLLVRSAAELSEAGRNDEALNGLRQAVALDGSRTDAWSLIGRILLKRGDFAAAVESMERAVEVEPSRPEDWRWLGLARSGAGDRPGALAAFRRAIDADPERSATWLVLAVHHLSGEDWDEAT